MRENNERKPNINMYHHHQFCQNIERARRVKSEGPKRPHDIYSQDFPAQLHFTGFQPSHLSQLGLGPYSPGVSAWWIWMDSLQPRYEEMKWNHPIISHLSWIWIHQMLYSSIIILPPNHFGRWWNLQLRLIQLRMLHRNRPKQAKANTRRSEGPHIVFSSTDQWISRKFGPQSVGGWTDLYYKLAPKKSPKVSWNPILNTISSKRISGVALVKEELKPLAEMKYEQYTNRNIT